MIDSTGWSKLRRYFTLPLCPIDACPITIYVGLNYKQHAEEAKVCIMPNVPELRKTYLRIDATSSRSDALAGPLDDIKVHPEAQIQLDYEGELVEDQALNYVLFQFDRGI
ncbi:fumarylacetoacetate hydrolase [Colletotrichum cuscutae]|uniref:Fumarylacetoacetate hydrolase n=1 Tax=Colletotrichum cuscutae TaxID=1209917 RepID=A0AAJ0DNP2_9PEZI|nr:fumarylacetoacetate hydrolase [Colletotrichum cuscutae]